MRNKRYKNIIVGLLFIMLLGNIIVISAPFDYGPLVPVAYDYIYDSEPLNATNVEAESATLNGWYGWNGTLPSLCGFYYSDSFPIATTNVTAGTYTNQSFSKPVTSLNSSTCYYFTVWVYNATCPWYRSYLNESFLTKPSGPPENFGVDNSSATKITLSWNNVTDWTTNPNITQTTIIRYSNTSQPATPTDGHLGYWGTSETYTIENLDLDVQYYFSAWTNIRAICNASYVRYKNSSEFATVTAYTQGGDYNIFVRYENRTYGLVNLSKEFPVYTCDKSDLIIYDEPFSTGDKYDVNVAGSGNLVLNTTPDGNYTLSGYRVSPEYSLSGVAEDSGTISWSEIIHVGTYINISYNLSINGGMSWNGWIQASNGGSVSGINIGTNMNGYLIKFRENLTTTNNLTTPELINLYIRIERTCMWVNHSGPHRVIIHYYGQDFDDYYGMVTYIIFENGTATHDPIPYFNYSNIENGTFNFSVNRTIKYIEFCWNDTTDCDFRCNRIISPVKGQRNITFFIRTDLPVFGEGTNYMNGSIVKYIYSFVDETGKFRRPNEPRATIYTYNDDEEKMIIHSEYFDDTEAIHPWLVYEKKYFIGVDCVYLTYERIGIAPASENQNPEVRIPYNYQFDYSFYDLINLDVGWFDSGFYVHYHDTTFSTVSATFHVYGYYNHTLVYSDSTTYSGKNFTYTCNTSGNYIWVIETTLDDLDNLYDGTYSSGETPMFSGMEPITDINTIDEILTIILGRTPLHDADNPNVEVPWTYIMIFALAFIVMTSLGKLNAFMGALGVGFVLTFSGAAITGLQTLFSNYDWWQGPVLILIGVFIIAFGIVGLMGGVED